MSTVLLQKQPQYPSAMELVKDYTSQWTIWLTEQQSAAITRNTADKTHRTVRKSSQVQRPHTEFMFIEYKAVQCIYGLTVWIMAICGGVAHREGAEGLRECRSHPTPLSDLGADDTGARLEIWVIFSGSICYDTVHIKTTEYMKKLGVSPHSFLVSQSETGHCNLLLLLHPLKNKVNKC